MYFTKISQCMQLVRRKPVGALVIMQVPSLIHFERTMWMKDLSYGWKEPTLSYMYFFKRRKQCKDESDKESTTMQIAQEDLNNVDDPTKEIGAQFIWVCLANIRISCDDFSLLWKSHIWKFLCCVFNFKIHSMFNK